MESFFRCATPLLALLPFFSCRSLVASDEFYRMVVIGLIVSTVSPIFFPLRDCPPPGK